MIAEVLSDSTEAYDRGVKFKHYRRLASIGCEVRLSEIYAKIAFPEGDTPAQPRSSVRPH